MEIRFDFGGQSGNVLRWVHFSPFHGTTVQRQPFLQFPIFVQKSNFWPWPCPLCWLQAVPMQPLPDFSPAQSAPGLPAIFPLLADYLCLVA
jgi:hypothetical protein